MFFDLLYKEPCFSCWESISGFQKWTKKMSKNENLKYFAQKAGRCDHNSFLWSGHKKNNFQNVSIKFFGQKFYVVHFCRF
jgi:hypothetical protein